MSHTLGIDIGTFETKGVLVAHDGTITATATRPHKMLVPRPGWAEHRADEDWWGDFVFVTKALLAQSGIDPAEIKAVAASAIGPCMLPVDAAGAPLTNGVLYGVDTRATAQIAALNAEIGEDVILARCGNALTSQSVGPKILWLKETQPEVFARTAKVLTSTSYLTWKLTGEYVIDHYTAANFSPLYDVGRQGWTSDLADILPLDRLPRLMWSTEIGGRITAHAAAETGLAEDTPVTCGTIDAAAEAVSVGVAAPGEMMVMYGSTIFMIQVTGSAVRDARLWYAPWLFPGRHASMAGLATSGTLTHWFRDQLARDADFAALAVEAAVSPKGAKGLICLPYFSGERTPIHDPHAKGAFFGMDLTHTRADLYRAVLEGIAMGTAHVFETCAEVGATPVTVRAVGGGTKNALWLQATSDVAGVTQEICDKSIGASYGDAFLAALAVGLVSEGDIARWNPVSGRVEPERVAAYERQYPLWKRLYAQTRDIAQGLGGRLMQFDRMRPHQIAEAVASGVPVVLPIGVMEYHGAHLPAGVDLLIVTETLKRLGDRIITLPPFAYGAASRAVAGAREGTLHVEPSAFLLLAEALFAGLLATGFRNLHGVIHHQTENFAQGMPTDLTFRLAARNAIFRHLEAARGPGWWGKGEMADYFDRHAAGEDPFNWIRIHPLFPKGADFPFDHAGVGETALVLELAPETVAMERAQEGGHWYTETAPQATRELGEKGVGIALSHMRSVLGLAE